MTYELECSGARLIVRVFHPSSPQETWRVEARASEDVDAVVATASAGSASAALDGVAQWWRDHALARALSPYDWNAVAQAMTAVRAI